MAAATVRRGTRWARWGRASGPAAAVAHHGADGHEIDPGPEGGLLRRFLEGERERPPSLRSLLRRPAAKAHERPA